MEETDAKGENPSLTLQQNFPHWPIPTSATRKGRGFRRLGANQDFCRAGSIDYSDKETREETGTLIVKEEMGEDNG